MSFGLSCGGSSEALHGLASVTPEPVTAARVTAVAEVTEDAEVTEGEGVTEYEGTAAVAPQPVVSSASTPAANKSRLNSNPPTGPRLVAVIGRCERRNRSVQHAPVTDPHIGRRVVADRNRGWHRARFGRWRSNDVPGVVRQPDPFTANAHILGSGPTSCRLSTTGDARGRK